MVRMMLELVCIGLYREVWTVDPDALHDWMQNLQRPPQLVLQAAIQRVADFAEVELRRTGGLWKMLKGTDPPIFEVRRDQARLYCCRKGADIVILAWEQKKRKASDLRAISLAERLAKEILNRA